jgi:hypothetical protein
LQVPLSIYQPSDHQQSYALDLKVTVIGHNIDDDDDDDGDNDDLSECDSFAF